MADKSEFITDTKKKELKKKKKKKRDEKLLLKDGRKENKNLHLS